MADFQMLAYEAIEGIRALGGCRSSWAARLYVASVVEGYESFQAPRPDLQYRAELEEYDTEALYAMLMESARMRRSTPGTATA